MTLGTTHWYCLIFLIIGVFSVSADPCLTYEEFQVDYKRSPGHVATVYEDSLCDVMVREKWYRFVGEAGSDMTNDRESLMRNSCGTFNPLWMDGEIPDVAEGIVDRKVCLKSLLSSCHKSFTIQVKNCCSYRVYYLHSANMCPSSYCVSQYNITNDNCTNSPFPTTKTTMTSSVWTKTTGTTSQTQHTTTESPTRSTTAARQTTPPPTMSTSSGRIQTTSEQTTGDPVSDPCLTYEEFQVDYKRSPDHIATVYEDSLCDVLVREKWYRFVGEAGGDMTNDRESLMTNSCGTVYPLWMDGEIPEVAEGIVDRRVCLKSVFSSCHKSFTIQVKNCCSYRVYYLHSANMCPSSYCVSQYNVTNENCTNSPLPTTTRRTSPVWTRTIGTTSRTQHTTTKSPTRPTTAAGQTTPSPTMSTSSGRIQTTSEQTTGDPVSGVGIHRKIIENDSNGYLIPVAVAVVSVGILVVVFALLTNYVPAFKSKWKSRMYQVQQ
ncbi:mucin-2-like [Mizuhopecten yessoensis]|uniref:mucin-2-like n=1 Tax=Mizuhopecten yessoensis TaxID=6573 RepID=UPI000B45ADC5|nr:mucin-2-like [Mizuhopecten yessoensis]